MGTLGLGMAEFGMMSILSAVAHNFDITIAAAGHLISAYALGVCCGAVLLVFLAQGRSLKMLLIALMLVMCLGNSMAVFAPDYPFMLTARFISGLPHGGYFGIAGIVAKKLSPPNRQIEAVAIMISGMTVANLFGIPLASFLAHTFSWHMLFVLIVLWGALTIFIIGRWVPEVPALPSKGLSAQFKFLQKPLPWILLFIIMAGNGGMFCWYSYINPLMLHKAGFNSGDMPVIMLIAGLGMVLGNYASGVLSHRFSAVRITQIMILLMLFASLGIFLTADIPWAAISFMFIGTFGLFGVSGPEQDLIIDISTGGEILGASGAQVAFNLGNALGALCGGIPMAFGYGVQYSAIPGITWILLGLAAVFCFKKLYIASKS